MSAGNPRAFGGLAYLQNAFRWSGIPVRSAPINKGIFNSFQILQFCAVVQEEPGGSGVREEAHEEVIRAITILRAFKQVFQKF